MVSPTLPFPLSLPSPFSFPLSFQTNQWEGRSDPVRGEVPRLPPTNTTLFPILSNGILTAETDYDTDTQCNGGYIVSTYTASCLPKSAKYISQIHVNISDALASSARCVFAVRPHQGPYRVVVVSSSDGRRSPTDVFNAVEVIAVRPILLCTPMKSSLHQSSLHLLT